MVLVFMPTPNLDRMARELEKSGLKKFYLAEEEQ
jgi:hypothetical protein